MSDERRRRADALFEAALQRPAEGRQRWLEAACMGDGALLQEVVELLRAHALAEGILEADVAGLFAGAGGAVGLEGRRMGPYRVLRELGRGGMGVVYLAERDDGQFQRHVAIKLLRAGPDAEELRTRFMAERQILASLDHPNIAQLLDAGVTDGQLPYLVMEYVRGLPITTYCDRQALDLGARLRLFQEVCAAVHHAHRNLVIHRDLKPGNILVTARGQVKLLDFGIAKLQNPALASVPLPVTRTELRVLTPEYASPEQARGEPLSTASDVYALGIVLHELLTGRRPHASGTGPGVVQALLGGREPVRPSTVIGDGADAAEAVALASSRSTTPERLRRALQGDLDAIVLMALRSESSRRYGSADLLAEDIHRYLDGLPVLAHRGSRRYYVGKFLRRHRRAAVAAALMAASVVAGTGIALWQASIARAERDRAAAALRQSEEVTNFLVGLFEAGDPLRTRGDTVTAGDLVDRGAARAERLSGQPLVQARMFDAVGRVYQSMGRYPEAEPMLERALLLQLDTRGPDHVAVADAMSHLAGLLEQRAQYDSAQALLLRAAELRRRRLGPRDTTYAATLQQLSAVAVHRGDLGEAERRARQALDIYRHALGPRDTRTIASLSRVGAILRERGDYTTAEASFREALHERRARGDPAVDELLDLAELMLFERGRAAEAERGYREALASIRRAPAPDETRLVRALGGLARVLEQRGDTAGAEALLRQALETRRRTYGPEHPLVSAGLIHLAGFYERTGRYDDAVALFQQVAALDIKLLGENHPTHAGTLTAIGRVLIAAGRLEAADSVLERALAIRIAALGEDHPLVAKTLRRRAEVQYRRGDYAAAEASARRALTIFLAQREPEATSVRDLRGLLNDVRAARARLDAVPAEAPPPPTP